MRMVPGQTRGWILIRNVQHLPGWISELLLARDFSAACVTVTRSVYAGRPGPVPSSYAGSVRGVWCRWQVAAGPTCSYWEEPPEDPCLHLDFIQIMRFWALSWCSNGWEFWWLWERMSFTYGNNVHNLWSEGRLWWFLRYVHRFFDISLFKRWILIPLPSSEAWTYWFISSE